MRRDKVIATITLGDVVRELVVFAICLVAAIALNAYAIVHYQTKWSELYTDIGFTVSLALIIYAARCVAKALIIVMWKLAKKLRHKMKR
ncbi:MAG: hypothetical protein IIU61_06340 [Alistipes sp.]|nr:hypothetical protein [Alistipes sp.]